jgi:hypothetical protein
LVCFNQEKSGSPGIHTELFVATVEQQRGEKQGRFEATHKTIKVEDIVALKKVAPIKP